ncbi:hypothetical protein [Beggiatoa leptomitoformis]|uniref:3'-5' exonuclease n=1 Tax=Beggiatoa leptomitoformis TaxID=288004 RepID=A0A2N9Y9X9_9GAMM|nr:hypothetical protein [Beggiatoa leptomitoformis]ALG67304.1 3'-5' exonuclease [Beggiatoa leptomitoformis]AUI67265.1 3'-5' exonuclease [Beggiatoa leptomitoformis]
MFNKKPSRESLLDAQFAFLFDPAPANEYVCIECETSTLALETAEVQAIHLVLIRDNRILSSQKLSLFVKSSAHPMEDNPDYLEPLDAVRQLLYYIGSRPVLGYYLDFDLNLLNQQIEQLLGFALPNEQIEVSGIYYNKRQSKSQPINVDLRFDTIVRKLDLPILGNANNALTHVITTALMYIKLQHLVKVD